MIKIIDLFKRFSVLKSTFPLQIIEGIHKTPELIEVHRFPIYLSVHKTSQ